MSTRCTILSFNIHLYAEMKDDYLHLQIEVFTKNLHKEVDIKIPFTKKDRF